MASLAEVRIEEPEDAAIEPQARPEELRILEALLFAASEPLDQATLAKRMPEGVDVKLALAQLQADYAMRGVNLVRVANKWTFRTAGDLAWLMSRESTETRKLSRAAIEVLAIVAYHQPVTRAEIEEIRGVVTSKGTLDVLLETGWIKPRGRRKTPGRPLTFGTTDAFLTQFSLESLGDLPGLEELKGTGLLDSRLPTGFTVPTPSDDPTLREDEEPLEGGDLDLALAPRAEPEDDDDAEGDAPSGSDPLVAASEERASEGSSGEPVVSEQASGSEHEDSSEPSIDADAEADHSDIDGAEHRVGEDGSEAE
jgi:segregation and condensation protein B